MKDSKQKTTGTPLYLLRIVAALYIMYQGYLIFKKMQEGPVDNEVILIIAIVVFTIFGTVLVVHSLYKLFVEYKNKDAAVEEESMDHQIGEEDKNDVTEEAEIRDVSEDNTDQDNDTQDNDTEDIN